MCTQTRCLLGVAAIHGLLVFGSNSEAQQRSPDSSQPDDAQARGLPEIVVIGSRILNVDVVRTLDDPQAYYILDSKQLARSGALNVETFLKQSLSLNTTALTNGQSADTRGTISKIDLRGVGATQTLVLINGRRAAAASLNAFQPAQPDINGIPVDAIERIEVLPSSSTGIYGGAAVGGVVNVILKQNFDGGKVSAQYGNTFSGDSEERVIDATFGTSFEDGRTNMMIAAHYADAEVPTFADRRELLDRGLQRILQNSPALLASANAPYNVGSTTNISSLDGSNLSLRPEYGGQTLPSSFTHVASGTAPSDPALAVGAALLANAGNYDVQPPSTPQLRGLQNPLKQRPVSKSILATLRRQMTDDIEVFGELARSENTATRPLGQFNSVLTIPAAAPTNPFQQGVRVAIPLPYEASLSSEHTSRRAALGFIATLPGDWSVQGDYTWNAFTYDYVNDGSDPFLAVLGPLSDGSLNPFVDTLLFPLSVESTSSVIVSRTENTLADYGLRFSGPIMKLPAGQVALTVGLGYRKEGIRDSGFTLDYPYSPASENNLVSVDPIQNQTVRSAYAETLVPVVSNGQGIAGIRELSLQAAVRTERYEVDAHSSLTESQRIEYTATKPMVGLFYRPIDSVALRVSHSSSFLPPGFSQFFPQVLQAGVGTTVVDPRRGNEVTAGIPQYIGGNPDVRPQESRDLGAGVILEPSFARGLRLSLDWYRLKLTNRLTNPTAQQMVDLEAQFPDRITRAAPGPGDPFGVGPITRIDTSVLAALELETEGVTASLLYQFQTDVAGDFDISLGATRILSFDQQFSLGEASQDVVDQIAFGGPLSFKANLSLGWHWRDWQVNWLTTHFASYEQYNIGGTQAYVSAQGSTSVDSQTYHDAVVSYDLPANASVRLGIRNVFDKKPPFDAFYSGTAYTSPFGDVRLRNYWLQVVKEF